MLLVMRPGPQCEGKMPYSPLSLAVVEWTRQSSAQKMNAPSPLKPLMVIPSMPTPVMRCAGSVRQSGPLAPLLAKAIP